MLIVIEGTDGSGKATQTKLLSDRLEAKSIKHMTLEFPRYSKTSSALIKSYLGGEFGADPASVNPYVASTFYAVDRIASYLSDWQKHISDGGLVLADRYTTSNATHQGSKFETGEDREDFFVWLSQFEYGYLGLPEPDLVVFLDVPIRITQEFMKVRETTDIHEADAKHLQQSKLSATHAADFYGWKVISCVDENNEPRNIEDIHADIWAYVCDLLKL